jgi:hypothetical protein
VKLTSRSRKSRSVLFKRLLLVSSRGMAVSVSAYNVLFTSLKGNIYNIVLDHRVVTWTMVANSLLVIYSNEYSCSSSAKRGVVTSTRSYSRERTSCLLHGREYSGHYSTLFKKYNYSNYLNYSPTRQSLKLDKYMQCLSFMST